MIYTSNYHSSKNTLLELVSISGDRGKEANYEGKCFPSLAPKKGFWQVWHNNIGKIAEEENNRFYVERYYEEVLKHLDPSEIYQALDDSILLCYEDAPMFCHRYIVAFWLELSLGISVPEIKIEEDKIIEIEKPTWIKEILEELMSKEEKEKYPGKLVKRL